MKYTVTYVVDGCLTIKVEADSVEEARRKGKDKAQFADLNRMDCIEMEDVAVEDEEDIVWER